MPFLRQSTAQTIRFGPCLDITDGVTEETALTLAQADMRLSKDGGAFGQKSAAGNATHDSDGWYSTTLSTTDTDTVGELILNVHQPANMLPVWMRWWVLEESIYNALFGAAAVGFDANQRVKVESVVATALDLILKGSTFALAIADAIADEVLIGATHNVVNSLGRRIRSIQEFQGYEGGAIWIDTVNGVAGTTDFENGTVDNPVLTLADAITLGSSMKMVIFHVLPGSSITFAEAHVNEVWQGEGWSLALGGQDLSNTHIYDADVTGTCLATTGQVHFVSCEIGTSTLADAELEACSLSGTITLSQAADYLFNYCSSQGSAGVIIDTGAAVANVHLDIHAFNGELDLRNVGQSGTDTIHVFGMGTLTINVNCIGGTIDVHGQFDLTDNGSSTVSFDDIRTEVAGIPTTAMRGTDSAILASSAPTNFSLMGIESDGHVHGDLKQWLGAAPNALISGQVDSAVGVKKNTALSNFPFLMVDDTDHVTGKTGLTFAAGNSQRSIDGAAFANTTNVPTEVSAGVYKVNLSAADLNGDTIVLKFTGTAADDRIIVIKTEA